MIKRTIVLYHAIPSWFGRDVLRPFLITRLALTLVAWLGFRLLPLSSAFPLSWEIGPDGAVQRTTEGAPATHCFINMWSRWDSGWYLQIARSGYDYHPGQPSSAAFFPLYPLAIRALHTLLLLPASDFWYLAVGIATSNLCLVAALVFLYSLVGLDYNDRVAARVVLCALVFPTSFFFSCAYSESMFLALTIGSLYYARKAHWITAAVLGAFAALCRSQGIILLLPLLLEYLAQRDLNPRRLRWDVAALGLIPLSVFLFAGYLRWRFGSWSTLFDAQQPWGRRLLAPWHTLPWVLTQPSPLSAPSHDWIDIAFFALLVAVSIFALRRIRLSYLVYLWTAVIFFSSWGMLGSIPRFVLVIFPMFICFGLACDSSPAFRFGYVVFSSTLGALLFLMHSQWQWVA